MKPEKTIEFLDYLLEPLELVTTNTSNSLIAIKHTGNRNSIAVTTGDRPDRRNFRCIYCNIDDVFNDLFNYIVQILYVDKTHSYDQAKVKNPYFKCQSLEEAAIKRDLLSNEA